MWLSSSFCHRDAICSSNVANVAQVAALEAVAGDLGAVAMMREAFDRRRQTMHRMLNEIDGVTCVEPKGAFYAFPDLSAFIGKKTPEGKTIENDVQLCDAASWYDANLAGPPK